MTVRALRVTYVGELGWELHVPIGATGDGLRCADGAGSAARHAPVGYRALESLRLEKGYRAWGSDITPNDTPLRGGARLGGEAAHVAMQRTPAKIHLESLYDVAGEKVKA
jgi:4-methylaminobutanoate oxidase (formaldehyde-forming)